MKTRVLVSAMASGGKGKTSISTNLAVALALKGKPVLLVDGDPQSTTTRYFGIKPGDYEQNNLASLLMNDEQKVTDVILKIKNIHIIPSSRNLLNAEKEIDKGNNKLTALKIKLKPIIDTGVYSYVIIDTPPAFGILTKNALCVTNAEIIMPIQAEYIALQGVQDFIDLTNGLIKDLQADDRPTPRFCGGVINMYDSRISLARDVNDTVRKNFAKFGIHMFNTIIRRNSAIATAPSWKMSVMEFDKNSNGAKDFMSLCDEIIAQEGEGNE